VKVPVEFVGFAIPDEFVVGTVSTMLSAIAMPYIGKVTLLDE
jgi:hypoxanthine phosphoribosyltransferase